MGEPPLFLFLLFDKQPVFMPAKAGLMVSGLPGLVSCPKKTALLGGKAAGAFGMGGDQSTVLAAALANSTMRSGKKPKPMMMAAKA